MKFTRTAEALEDIDEALFWSASNFGRAAARRYRNPIATAIREIALDPELAGSRELRGIPGGIRLYHISLSRNRAAVDGLIVKRPRHFISYRLLDSETVEIVRVLHDSMDVDRHLP